jgi:diguanylate cyclase (GGDEF)-like protein/PAS domain S-box-containing protein
MNWTFVSFVFAAAAVMAALVAASLWRQRRAPGAVSFGLLLLAAAEWALLSAFEKAVPGLANKVALAKLEYFGIASVAPLWFFFVVDYTRQGQRLSRAVRLALWVIPVAAILLAQTNEAHHLIWTDVHFVPGTADQLVDYEHGPLFYLNAAYSYLAMAAGGLLLLRALFRWPHLYRKQALALLVGLALPWVSNVLYLLHVLPAGLDPTPLAFSLTGVVYGWALFRYHLLDVLPVAREALVEGLPEGVVVLGGDGRIVDVNPAGQRLLGEPIERLVGQPLASAQPGLAPAWPESAAGPEARQFDVELPVEGQSRMLAVTVAPMAQPGTAPFGAILTLHDVTSHRQAEAALRESQTRFLQAFEAAAIGMALVGLDGRWMQVNPALCELLGYSEAELLALDFQAVTHPDDLDADLYNVRQLIAGEISTYQMEKRYYHKQGHVVWVLLTVALVRGDSGEALYFISQIQDISDRKRIDRRIQAFSALALKLNLVTTPKEAARLILEAADDLFGWDAAYLDTYSSDHNTVMTILTYDLFNGERTEFPPDPGSRPPGRMQTRVIEGGRLLVERGDPIFNELATSTFGDTARVSETLMFVPIRHGTRVMGILSIQSYTPRAYTRDSLETLQALADLAAGALDRIQAQTELRQSEARNRYLIEHADDLIFETDAQGRITSFNPMAPRLLQVPAEALAGRPVMDLVHPAHRHAVQRHYQRQLIRRIPSTYSEAPVVTQGGEIWLGQNVQLVFDEAERITGFQVVARDVTRRKQAEEQLRHLALHDALTGLPNRVLFMDRLERTFERARRNPGAAFAVLYLDLDRFKTINDSLGHQLGDEVLKAAARRLVDCVRAEDTVARMGGDEFVVLLDEVREVRGAILAAERLLHAVNAPFHVGGQEVFLATSIGIALSGPDYQQPEAMLRDADIALYRAKASGKARFAVFDEALFEQASYHLALEADLHLAVERDQLRLVYQPIVSLADGRLHGFEALLRWQHPTRGLLTPDRFLSLAEETGHLAQMDAWVLRQAARQAGAWQARLPAGANVCVSVNLSRPQLQSGTLVEQVRKVLAETGLPPHSLCLEVTETVAVEAEGTLATLAALHALGIRLHVDDFGTGTSSLRMLHAIPFDVLKLDRAFVQDMGDDALDGQAANRRGALAIARTVVLLARELGRQTVAEGVETEAQLEQLKALGCDFGQGYLFSRPLFADTAELMLAERVDGG